MTPEEKRETFKYLVDLSAYHHSVMRQTDFFAALLFRAVLMIEYDFLSGERKHMFAFS